VKELILGVIQGFTEFLPVSSSGHLVVGQALLGIHKPGIGLEVLLHLGTALAIVIYFRKDLKRYFDFKTSPRRNLLFLVVLGSIPAGLVGGIFSDVIEKLFESVKTVSLFFIFNGLFLLSTGFKKFSKEEDQKEDPGEFTLGPFRAFLIGCAQAIAILPGISRSGSTIGSGLFLDVAPEEAFRFSFLLALPAILGAALLEARKGEITIGANDILAFLASAITGLFALVILRRAVVEKKLPYFGLYTLALGVLLLILGVRG